MKDIAIKYYKAGLSVIPTGNNKIPVGSWKENQLRLIEPKSESEAIGIVCGRVSGGVECIDFDLKYDRENIIYDQWRVVVADNGGIDIFPKLIYQKTQSNGVHVVYRCSKIEGNLKLAQRETVAEERTSENDRLRVLIETRGEGGYFVAAPSRGYELLYGDFEHVQEITPEERDILLTSARSFNKVFEQTKNIPAEKNTSKDELSPFEDYNSRGNIESLLESNGWVFKGQRGDNKDFLRPGGTQVRSADFDCLKRLFYVFTSSSSFDAGKAYNPSQVYKTLNNISDWGEVARRLKSEGYGGDSKPKKYNDLSFLVGVDNEYMNKVRSNTLPMGLTTGFEEFDIYWRFKRGNFNIINGHDNVGKSLIIWYFLVIASRLHKWKHLIYSSENRHGFIRRKLMEFSVFKKLSEMKDEEYRYAEDFVKKHFAIIDPSLLLSYRDALDMAKSVHDKQPFDCFMADPYNSFLIDLKETSKLNTHEYHYQATSEMRQFCSQRDVTMFLNCHAVTEALRRVDSMGYPLPPNKADTEGGGKFSNRADDFWTVHRQTQNPDKWMETQIIIRKVKEQESGGRPTPLDQPFILVSQNGATGFVDGNGYNPIINESIR